MSGRSTERIRNGTATHGTAEDPACAGTFQPTSSLTTFVIVVRWYSEQESVRTNGWVAETLTVVTIAFIVGAIAVLYRLALTGDRSLSHQASQGLYPDRTESQLLRALLFVVTYGAGPYALFVFDGVIRVSTGIAQWRTVIPVGIFVVVLVTDGLPE